jgi:hypothetical protein
MRFSHPSTTTLAIFHAPIPPNTLNNRPSIFYSHNHPNFFNTPTTAFKKINPHHQKFRYILISARQIQGSVFRFYKFIKNGAIKPRRPQVFIQKRSLIFSTKTISISNYFVKDYFYLKLLHY